MDCARKHSRYGGELQRFAARLTGRASGRGLGTDRTLWRGVGVGWDPDQHLHRFDPVISRVEILRCGSLLPC